MILCESLTQRTNVSQVSLSQISDAPNLVFGSQNSLCEHLRFSVSHLLRELIKIEFHYRKAVKFSDSLV